MIFHTDVFSVQTPEVIPKVKHDFEEAPMHKTSAVRLNIPIA